MLLISITIIGAVVASLVALLTLVRNPTSGLHRWLFLLIVAACSWVVSVNLHSEVGADAGLWLLRLAFLSALFLGFAMIRFCQEASGVAMSLLGTILFPLIVMGGFLLSLSPLVIEGFSDYSAVSVEPQRGIAYPFVLIVILYLVLHSLVLLNRYRRRAQGLRRTQLWIIELGLIFGTVVGFVSNAMLPNITMTTYPSRFAFIAILILTATLVYAVVQHRFLDIRLAVARTVVYIASLAAIAVLYAALMFAVVQLALGDLPVSDVMYQGAYVVVAAIVAATFHPLRMFFGKLTNRLLFRDAYDTKVVLDAVSDTLVHEVDVKTLAKKAGAILSNALKVRYIEVVLLNSDKSDVARRIVIDGASNDIAGLVKRLLHSSHKMVAVDDMQTKNSTLQQDLIRANVAVAARLETSKERLGYLLVGYKENGAAYTVQDTDLIRIAVDELAVAIQNSLRFEEILHFNKTLKQEIQDATAELRESNRKLHKLDEAKDEFISMASHQLRTPLTSVKGYLSMVLEGDVGKVDADQRKVLLEAYGSAQRMVYLIGDFLNVSRLTTGRFAVERASADLPRLVKEEVEQLAATASRRDIRLVCHLPAQFPEVMIDENKIRQVVMNLVDNAIFYSKPGGMVAVELLAAAHQAIFKVRDNGIGVPEGERHKLFTKFFRASNARRVRPDGTGVGLFMTQKVIVAHGGSIIFETKLNRGSTFGFALPLKNPAQQLKDKKY